MVRGAAKDCERETDGYCHDEQGHEARPPAPAPRHNPSPQKHHENHRHDDNDGWLMLGAGIIGGIVGG